VKLTLQDRLALMMTGVKSQRELARRIGVSHQRVGRWLTIGGTLPDGSPSRVREPTDPAILAAIDRAWRDHKARVRARARADDLPYSSALPAQFERLRAPVLQRVYDMETSRTYTIPVYDSEGREVFEPGARVVVRRSHWMRDELRNAVLAFAHNTGRYIGASVQSLVNLNKYLKNADKIYRSDTKGRLKGIPPTEKSLTNRAIFELERKLGVEFRPINTKMTMFGDPRIPADLAIYQIVRQLEQKHQPATFGIPGALYATEILLQTRASSDRITAEREARIREANRRADSRRRALKRQARKAASRNKGVAGKARKKA
jgi:hypothetical protein